MVNNEYDIKQISGQLIRLAKDSIVYGVTYASSLFSGLFLMPLFTRIFTTAQYGAIEIINTSTTVIYLIAGLQIDAGVARHYYECKDEAEKRRLTSTGLLLKLAIPVVICAALLPWLGQISSAWLGSSVYQKALFFSFLTVPLNNILTYFLYIFRLQWSKKKYVILSVGNYLLMMLLAIFFTVYLKFSIEGIFLGYFIAYLLFAVLGLFLLRKNFTLNFSVPFARVILVYSAPLVPAVVANWLRYYLDRFLLIPLVGLAGVGIYSAGVKIASAVMLIHAAFQLAWQPFSVYLISKENHKAVYSKVLTYYVALMSCVAIITIIFSKEILHIFTPSQYWDARKFVGFVIAPCVLNGAFTVMGIGLVVVKKTYLQTISYLSGLGAGIIFLYLLTPRIGVTGAAVGSLICSMVALVVQFFLAQRNYAIDYDMRRLVAIFLVVLCFVPITLVTDGNLHGIADIGVKIVELIVFYLCILIILPRTEVSVILNLAKQQFKGLTLALNSRANLRGRQSIFPFQNSNKRENHG